MLKKNILQALNNDHVYLFWVYIRWFIENCLVLIIIFKFVHCNFISQVCFVYWPFWRTIQIKLVLYWFLIWEKKYAVTMSFARRRNVRRQICLCIAVVLFVTGCFQNIFIKHKLCLHIYYEFPALKNTNTKDLQNLSCLVFFFYFAWLLNHQKI